MEFRKDGDTVSKRGEVLVLGENLTLSEDAVGHPLINAGSIPVDTPPSGLDLTPVCSEVAMHAGGGYDLELSGIGAALQEISERSRQWFNAQAFNKVRMVAEVRSPGSAGTAALSQYSTDGTTWYFFDGGSGPALAIDTVGALRGIWADMTPAAQTDIQIRWCTIGADGVVMPVLGKLAVEFVTPSQDIDPGGGGGGGGSLPTPLAWHIAGTKFSPTVWGDITLHGNDLSLVGGGDPITLDGEALSGRPTVHFGGASAMAWPAGMFGAAFAGEAFVLAKPTAGGASFLDTFTASATRIDGTAPLSGHLPDQGGAWEAWSGPYDAGLTADSLAIKSGGLTDRENSLTGGTTLSAEGAAMAPVLGTWAVGDEAYVDVTFPVGSGTSSQLFHLAILVSPDSGSNDMPLTNGYVTLEFDRGSGSPTMDVFAILEYGRVGGGLPGGSYAFQDYTTTAVNKRLGVTFVSHEKLSIDPEAERWGIEIEAWEEPLGGGARTTIGSFVWGDENEDFAPASLLEGTRDRIAVAYSGTYNLATTSTAITTDDCESYAGSNPAPWTLTDPAGTNATFTADATFAHAGTTSLKVQLAGLFNPGTVKISRPLTGLDPDSHYQIRFYYYRTGSWGFGVTLNAWTDFTGGSLGQTQFLTSDSSGNATLDIVVAVGGGPNSGAIMWIDDIRLVGPLPRIQFDNLTATPGSGGGGSSALWRIGAAGSSLGDGIVDGFGSTTTHSAAGDQDHFVLWNPRSSISEWTGNLNGQQAVTTPTNAVSFSSAPLFASDGVSPGNIDAAEIMLFDHVLLPAERDAVVADISNRWGLGLSTPVVTPPGPGGPALPPIAGGRAWYLNQYDQADWGRWTPPFYATLIRTDTVSDVLTTLAQCQAAGMRLVFNGMPKSAAGSGGSGGSSFNFPDRHQLHTGLHPGQGPAPGLSRQRRAVPGHVAHRRALLRPLLGRHGLDRHAGGRARPGVRAVHADRHALHRPHRRLQPVAGLLGVEVHPRQHRDDQSNLPDSLRRECGRVGR
jgi:hypothetical protein